MLFTIEKVKYYLFVLIFVLNTNFLEKIQQKQRERLLTLTCKWYMHSWTTFLNPLISGIVEDVYFDSQLCVAAATKRLIQVDINFVHHSSNDGFIIRLNLPKYA
jgi:hypothetical protein